MPQRIAMISDHASPLAAVGGSRQRRPEHLRRRNGALPRRARLPRRRLHAQGPTGPARGRRLAARRARRPRAGRSGRVRSQGRHPAVDAGVRGVRAAIRGARALRHRARALLHVGSRRDAAQERARPAVRRDVPRARSRARLHQGAADEFSPKRIAIERDIIRGADAIVAECPDDRRNLVTLYNADPHKIAVIPCGFAQRRVLADRAAVRAPRARVAERRSRPAQRRPARAAQGRRQRHSRARRARAPARRARRAARRRR